MLDISNGMIRSDRIIQKRYPSLEHGVMKKINGIILHQTSNDYTQITMTRYALHENYSLKLQDLSALIMAGGGVATLGSLVAGKQWSYILGAKGIGAHFLIEPEGTIYQTARIDQICHHVGYIKSKCRETQMCEPKDMQTIIGIERRTSKELRKKLLHKHELKKSYPARYPTNDDSIGIEVVGAPKNDIYQSPTVAQNEASRWLVTQLLLHFKLKRTRVYSHGQIGSEKNPTEATQVEY